MGRGVGSEAARHSLGKYPDLSGRFRHGLGGTSPGGRLCSPARAGRFLACAHHLEAVVSSCRAGLGLRSGGMPLLWRPPKGPRPPPRPDGNEGQEKEKNGRRAEGGAQDCLSVLKSLWRLPHIGRPGGAGDRSCPTPGRPPAPKPGAADTHVFLVLN